MKLLILGSGAIKIGEAGEFDYSGSQAIKAMKEAGVKTVLINPNIATIQTSENMADTVYFLPVTPYFVEEVIRRERPEGVLLSFGGQTALNCGMDLHRQNIFQKYGVKIFGTPMEAVILSEDRAKFARHLKKIGQPVAPSEVATSPEKAVSIAKKIGYPVMVRAGYTLGGQKSGIARNRQELEERARDALVFAPQILIEKYLYHYKEIEYEIVRDKDDNCITVCNMENFDPMGIHTGESIVVAPSQTLTSREHHALRSAAIAIARSLAIVGECNVQFALNPRPADGTIEYFVIELNARLSRSSALASKAVGYPLAYVAALLALGRNLNEIENRVTLVTKSCFEPMLDYIVVKIPRWDLEKFKGVDEKIGSSMKSVGEVMAIGRTFEEAIQKAVRMLDAGSEGATHSRYATMSRDEAVSHITHPTPRRLFAIIDALRKGIRPDDIHEMSGIDPWFLHRLGNIVELEKQAGKRELDKGLLLLLKRMGFADVVIGRMCEKSEQTIRLLRKKWDIVPSVFQIDTLAGEVPARTNYLYMTYTGGHDDVKPLGRKGVMVLGSGPYHIGSSVEFDWTCVATAERLKKHKKQSIIVNCNPETVSTDYDISDRLYFEELTAERVQDIYDFEQSAGVVVSVGGQKPNTIAKQLVGGGVPVIGTSPADIDLAEDRNAFSRILDEMHINQPRWKSFTDVVSIEGFIKEVGFPVLVRPSYVLSGSAMAICYTMDELRLFVEKASLLNRKHPVTVSQFISDAKEIEFDAVAQDGRVVTYAISEHVEHAGVHSGDATVVYPAQEIYHQTERRMTQIAADLAGRLHVTGPFNIQFLAKEQDVYVIEMNARASRTFPFISKASGVNFAHIITDSFFGKAKRQEPALSDHVAIKVPQFSFARLEGADPVLRVEMASTGEVACFGRNVEEAYLKGLYSTGMTIDKKAALVSLGGVINKERFLTSVWRLKNLGFRLYATDKTHAFLRKKGIASTRVRKVYEHAGESVVDIIQKKKVSLVINLSEPYDSSVKVFEKQVTDGYLIRRTAVDNKILLFTDLRTARYCIRALSRFPTPELLPVLPWDAYIPNTL